MLSLTCCGDDGEHNDRQRVVALCAVVDLACGGHPVCHDVPEGAIAHVQGNSQGREERVEGDLQARRVTAQSTDLVGMVAQYARLCVSKQARSSGWSCDDVKALRAGSPR